MVDLALSSPLPDFNSHAGHRKLVAATEQDVAANKIQRITWRLLEQHAGPMSASVLDFGCGRGIAVAAMRRRDYAAYGVDVDARYLGSGSTILPERDALGPVLSLLDANGRSIFPDETFDAIVSDQVLEHVADLGSVAHEIARLLKPGGISIHHFPARFRIVEPHMLTPLAHWTPKGAVRRAAIGAALRLGLSAPHFRDYPHRDRTEIFSRFSNGETFYRSLREIRAAFAAHGLKTRSVVRQKLSERRGTVARLARMPGIGHVGALLFANFGAMSIVAEKP